jgi:hypothetical protein
MTKTLDLEGKVHVITLPKEMPCRKRIQKWNMKALTKVMASQTDTLRPWISLYRGIMKLNVNRLICFASHNEFFTIPKHHYCW